MRTRLAVAVATLSAGALLPAPVRAAGCAAVWQKKGWTTVDTPAFPAPADTWNGGSGWPDYPLVAGGATANETFVSNGVAVLRTGDGGCTWQTVFSLGVTKGVQADPGVLAQNAFGHIAELVVAPARGVTHVYLLLRNELPIVSALPQPTVVVTSDDGGASWRAATVTMACDGKPGVPMLDGSGLTAGGTGGVYLTTFKTQADGSLNGRLVASTDGGRTWTCGVTSPGGTEVYRADPIDPRGVWSASCAGARRSTDAGVTWTARLPYPSVPGETCTQVDGFDVWHPAGGGPRLAVLLLTHRADAADKTQLAYVSTDAKTFRQLGTLRGSRTAEFVHLLGFRYDGAPIALVDVGIVSISPATAHVVRTWSDRKRTWADASVLVARMPACPAPAISGVAQAGLGDAARGSLVLRADVNYSNNRCPALVLHYRAR